MVLSSPDPDMVGRMSEEVAKIIAENEMFKGMVLSVGASPEDQEAIGEHFINQCSVYVQLSRFVKKNSF